MQRALRDLKAAGKRAASSTDYGAWTREALVRRIGELEGRAARGARKRRREDAPMDFAAYPTRHVALKIAYLGWDYSGLASQQSYRPPQEGDGAEDAAARKDTSHITTVEDVLFSALQRCRLIVCPRTCSYSRCGRTDAGVSASGQVVALTVRSSQRRTAVGGDAFDLPLVATLNRALPPDVRVLAAAEAPARFHARFDCRGRTYRYFFPARGLDIAAMAAGAARLVGEHDFRNFARKDPSGRATVTTRQLYAFSIAPLEGVAGWCVAEVSGSSFLYNQVRCMMAVLLRVGRGLEAASVVDAMLDTEAHPAVPLYDIADENPLVLVHCRYDAPLAWRAGGDTWLPSMHWALQRTLLARALVARDVMSAIEGDAHAAAVDPFWDGNRPIPALLRGPVSPRDGRASPAPAE